MQDFRVNFRKTFLYVLINALLIVGILSIASACNNNNTPQPDGTSSQPDGTSTQTTGTITPIPTPAPYYFLVDLNPVPDLENPGKMAVNFKIRDYYRTNPEKSRIWLEFHWTNIYGSYSEAKRAELVPLNEVLVSGETSWEGDTSIYNIVTLSSQIKLPREGVWKIKATFSTNGEVILTDSIKVAVAEGTSVIMYTEEFYSSPLAHLDNISYGGISEKVLDELHPVFIALDISKAPRVGEEAVLTYRIESLYEVTDFSTQFVVDKRTIGVAVERVSPDKIISGNSLSWQGDLIPGQPIVVTSTIVFPEEGDWKIGIYSNSLAREQINYSGYSDYIWINVTDTRGSFGWEEPQINPCVTIATPTTTIPTTIPTTPTTTIPSENTTWTQTTTNP